MNLTREQVIDAMRIHVDECKAEDCLTSEMVDRVEAAPDDVLTEIVRTPAIAVLLAQRYYPDAVAALKHEPA
jgi:hypothetical protein